VIKVVAITGTSCQTLSKKVKFNRWASSCLQFSYNNNYVNKLCWRWVLWVFGRPRSG